jgi:hypothetical protein
MHQSYGGFMSSKVVEANEGVHSLAIAIAVSFCGLFFRTLIDLPNRFRVARYELAVIR